MVKFPKIRLAFCCVAVVVIVFVGYMTLPLSFSSLFVDDKWLTGSLFVAGVENGIPFTESQDFNLENNLQLHQLKEVIGQYSYHRTLDTIVSRVTGKIKFGDATQWNVLINGEDKSIWLFSDGIVIINDVSYRLYRSIDGKELLDNIVRLIGNKE